MTIVFGNLVNEFNDFSTEGIFTDELKRVVSQNAYGTSLTTAAGTS